MNQEPQRGEAVTQVHCQVAGLLRRPHRGRGDRVPQPRQLTLDPSLPQVGFSPAMRMISALTEVPLDGRPGLRRLV